MILKRIPFFLGMTIVLAACSIPEPNIDGAQYWQRVTASDAAYQQGPKVQQMLNRDLGRCVVELRELEKIGAIKDAIPTENSGRLLDPDQRKLSDNDTPDHDGALLAEQGDYHDFDGCMLAKGWERVKYVPYNVAEQARVNYFRASANHKCEPCEAHSEKAVRESKPVGAYNE